MKKKDLGILGISRLHSGQGGSSGEQHASPATITPPATSTEIKLAAIWQATLPGVIIGRESNFVALGGDSLSLAQVIVEVESAYGIHLSTETIANNLSLQGMAAVIDNLVANPAVKK